MSNSQDFDRQLPALESDHVAGAANWQVQRTPYTSASSTLKTTPTGQLPEVGFNGQTLLKAFRRQWIPAIGLGFVLMMLVGALAWVLLPTAKYTAKATLLVSNVRPKVIFNTAEPVLEFATYQKTQVALITSRHVLNAVLRDPKVAQLQIVREQLDPLEWLEKDLKVEFPLNSTVLQLSIVGDYPTDLATIINIVTEQYMDKVVDQEVRDRRKRLDDLSVTYEKEQTRLKDLRTTLRQLTLDAGSSDKQTLIMKQQFDLETLAYAQRERIQLQSRIRLADIKVKMLEASRNNMTTGPVPVIADSGLPVQTDAVLQELAKQRNELQRKLDDLKRKIRRPNDPAVLKSTNDLATIKKAIQDRQTDLLSRGGAPVNMGGSAGPEPQSDLDTARQELAVLVQFDQALEQDIETRKGDVKQQNLTTQDVQTESEAIAMVAQTASSVGKEVEEMKLEMTAPPRVKVVNKADVPKLKDEAKRLKMCAGAAFGAFVCGLLGVSLWEYRTRRIYSTHEVVESLGLNLVGTLPALPTSTGRAVSRRGQDALDRWHSLMVESIDATRTMLMHVARVEGLRAVMITSALKGEGKTSLSSHLATSLARAGLRTLLVDSDLRNPSVHRLYDLPPEPGLCELLRGEISLEDAIVEVVGPSPLGTLSVLPAGRCDPQALSALAQDGMRNLLGTLKTRYDFVIVDSAPVLPVADTLLIGQQVDAVLFSILRDVSRVHHVHAAYDRLSRLGVRMLGAVINGESPSNYGSKYSYGYNYGSTIKAG